MPSILDLVPKTTTVKVANLGEVDVPGLGLDGIAFLFNRHPELLKLFSNGSLSVDNSKLFDMGLDVTASIMAAGLGLPGNAEAEEKCRKLNPEDAWNILEAILEVSFPGGPRDFFEKMNRAFAAFATEITPQKSKKVDEEEAPASKEP